MSAGADAAIAALIQIGPEVSGALIHTPREGMTSGKRLAAILAVFRVKNVSGAREYLTSASGEANLQRYRAEEGLKALEH